MDWGGDFQHAWKDTKRNSSPWVFLSGNSWVNRASYPNKRKGKVHHHTTVNNHNTGSESQRRSSRDKESRNHEKCPWKIVRFNYQLSVRCIPLPQTLWFPSARIRCPQAWTNEGRFSGHLSHSLGQALGGYSISQKFILHTFQGEEALALRFASTECSNASET